MNDTQLNVMEFLLFFQGKKTLMIYVFCGCLKKTNYKLQT